MILFRLFLLLGFLVAYTDDGIGIDPHGGARPSFRTTSDDGNGFDPHGTPRTSGSDAGSCIDPNGGCTDSGGGMDPNG